MKNSKKILLALALLLPVAAEAQVVYPGSGGSVTTGVSIVGTSGTTETLPTTTDTLAGLAATQTLTNKTITSPIVTGTFTGNGVTFGSAGSNVYGTGFGSFAANPLVQVAVIDVKTASVNTPVVGNLIASASGRTIYPILGGISITATGTAAGATNVQIACAGGTGHAAPLFGNAVATFPVAALVSNVPAMATFLASAITYGSASTEGCTIGDGLTISTGGSALTTTTDLFVTIPYVVQ